MNPCKIIQHASHIHWPKRGLRSRLCSAFEHHISLNNTEKTAKSLEYNDFSEKMSLMDGKLSDIDKRLQNQIHSSYVPRGSLAVYVGHEERRFVVPTSCLSMPEFKELMDSAAEEYGFEHQGGLHIPCEEEDFEEILVRCLKIQQRNKKKKSRN
ncbi:hypothetical protein ACFE04_031757 [Oxalis oulophora]